MHCYLVFGKIRVNDAAGLLIGNRGFHQSGAESK